MAYTPRAGSTTEKIIDFIRKKGTARTDEIVSGLKVNKDSISTLIKPAIDAGLLLVCKVSVPGKQPVNEYRIGSGITPVVNGPELKAKKAPPRREAEVVTPNGNDIFPDPDLKESEPAIEDSLTRQTRCDRFTVQLDSEGRIGLFLEKNGKQVCQVFLDRDHALVLKNFIKATLGVWPE